jgi:hypothetical protein
MRKTISIMIMIIINQINHQLIDGVTLFFSNYLSWTIMK